MFEISHKKLTSLTVSDVIIRYWNVANLQK